MPGSPQANYKMVQRFFAETDPKEALLRLYHGHAEAYLGAAPSVLVDPTKIPKPQARRAEYVDRLKDGRTRGFWPFVFATSHRGRAIPSAFTTYSSRRVNQAGVLGTWSASLGRVRGLVGEKPLVMDREFSYGNFLRNSRRLGCPWSSASIPPALPVLRPGPKPLLPFAPCRRGCRPWTGGASPWRWRSPGLGIRAGRPLDP